MWKKSAEASGDKPPRKGRAPVPFGENGRRRFRLLRPETGEALRSSRERAKEGGAGGRHRSRPTEEGNSPVHL